MIFSMNRPGEAEPFALKMCGPNEMASAGFDDSSREDFFSPVVQADGRGSGTWSPSSSSLDGPAGGEGYTSPVTVGSSGATGGLGGSNHSGNAAASSDDSKSFPLVLHAIVNDEGSDGCIHWLPCGSRFVISNKDVFSRDVLPQYFGQRGGSATKFTSFTRRLKRWNFSRVPSGREMGAYFHENFRRGEPDMANRIIYPIRPPGGQPPPTAAASSKGSAKAKKAGAKKPSSRAKAAGSVPKARRRASTGCLARRPELTPNEEPFDLEAVLENLSPTPIRPSLSAAIERGGGGGIPLPPPALENDIKDWLSSANLLTDIGEGIETPSTHSTIAEPVPLSTVAEASPFACLSSAPSFLLPPLAFPGNFISGGTQQLQQQQQRHQLQMQMQMQQQQQAQQPMMMRPGLAVRRHSVALENLNQISMSMMAGLPNAGGGAPAPSSFPLSQQMLLGTNFSYGQMAADGGAGDGAATMAFCQNVFPATAATAPSPPLQPMSGGGGGGDDSNKDSPSFSREFSFDDFKMIDPFT